MDEAGMANPAQEPYVVVSAVILDGDHQLLVVEHYLRAIVDKYIPEDQRNDFIFHAFELFGGYGFFKDRDVWPIERRLEIADELSEICEVLTVPITFGLMPRDHSSLDKVVELPENPSQRDLTVLAHTLAYVHCCVNVERWMRENTSNENCLLIVENNDTSRKTIAETQRFHQDPRNYELWSERERQYFPFTKIRQSPLFEVKGPYSALQLSDYCAYVCKRIVMGDEKYQRFWGPMTAKVFVPHLAKA